MGQKIEGKKLFSIKVAIGEYLNLKTISASHIKGVFDGITKGKVLPVRGDFLFYHLEDGKTYTY